MFTNDPWTVIALFAVVFACAGFVKGVVGLGLPTVAMALLVLLTTPPRAAALLLVPALLTNVWQLRPWNTLRSTLCRLAPLQAGIVIGTTLGAWLVGAPSIAAMRLLGAILIAYAIWGLATRSLRIRQQQEAPLGLAAGALTGIITAATGVFVIPAIPYLQSLALTRDDLMQAMGLSFTTSTLALFAVLFAAGHAPAGDLALSTALLLPALLGMRIGQRLQRHLPQARFRQLFFAALTLLGAHLLLG